MRSPKTATSRSASRPQSRQFASRSTKATFESPAPRTRWASTTTRHFSFTVKPAANVLVVSDLAIDGEFIRDAIDPSTLPPGSPRPFRVDRS